MSALNFKHHTEKSVRQCEKYMEGQTEHSYNALMPCVVQMEASSSHNPPRACYGRAFDGVTMIGATCGPQGKLGGTPVPRRAKVRGLEPGNPAKIYLAVKLEIRRESATELHF